MIHSFQYLPAGLAMTLGTLAFIGFFLVVAFVLTGLRSPVWKEAFRSLHPPLCAGLMVAFAIFAVIVANTGWHDQEEAHRTARSEAYALKRLLYNMPAEGQGRELIKHYMESVIHDEWPRMEEGRRGHTNTTIAILALSKWVMSPDVPYANESQRQFFQAAMSDLGSSRDKRLTLTRATIPKIIWVALLSSAIVVMLGVIMAHAHARRSAFIMCLLYGSIIGAILSALLLLDHPYAGSVSVTTHHVQDVLDRFENPPHSTPQGSP